MKMSVQENSKALQSLVSQRERLVALSRDITAEREASTASLHQDVIAQAQAAEHLRRALRLKSAASIASFRFQHAPDLINGIRLDPRAMGVAVDLQHHPWMDEEHLAEMVLTMRVLQEYTVAGTLPLVPDFPLILSCPRTLEVGASYTLLGFRFGVSTGKLILEVEGLAAPLALPVTQWSGTAVTFRIPETLEGVAFGAQGRLTLERLAVIGNGQGLGSDCTTSVRVVVEPARTLWFSRDTFSDTGKSPSPWYDYKRSVTLKSPALPASFRLFESTYQTESGLVVSGGDNADYICESGSRIDFGTLYQTDNSLRVDVTIKDDWYWNYTVCADFYILAPNGFALVPGWDHH